MAESQVNFTNEVLLATPILIPTVHEQYRIAEILKAVDETMRLTRNLIAKLVQIKQGMRRHLLTCGVGDDGRPRDPEKNPELFRHSPIGSIPRDWTVARLGSLVEILDNLRVPVSGEERLLRQGSVPYYGANGQQGFIDRALFDEPLILLAEDGGFFDEFATRAIAYRIDGPSWVNNHAHVLRACGINFEYLFQSLEHRDIRRFIAGGTRSKLIQSELRAIPIPVAPKAEQIVLAEALRTQDTLVSMEEAHLRVLEGVRRGLLVDLLTGRVRVKGDEAAA
jgi:type I restriction enzyme, S subunit